jgi:hypothetical protein
MSRDEVRIIGSPYSAGHVAYMEDNKWYLIIE